MNIKLLKKDFEIKSINIETEEVFQHLKDFLIEDAHNYIKHKLCSIYWYYKDEKMLWYITISTSTLKIRDKHLELLSWKMDWLEWISFPVPGVLIWKFLVNKDNQWEWIWKDLLLYIMWYCYELSKTIWIRFIIIDSNPKAVSYYEKFWFVTIESKKKSSYMVFDLNLYDDLD